MKLMTYIKKPDTSAVVKEADCNSKITEIEGKIPSITVLATTSATTIYGYYNLWLLMLLRIRYQKSVI